MRQYTTFEQFWPHYLREHAKPGTRLYHYIGTGLGLIAIAAAVVTGNWLLILLVPLLGYGFAWVSHAFVERNKPATFTYPFWSLMSDYRMFFLAMTGRLKPELQKAGVSDASPADGLRSSPNQ
ncbi:DUF962 domain-containing protein [Parvularcula sp. ZS-1/3]|uniref:DUF962 domain-containing protein n=1 Tax=Parvularcula mediterranea TaxID=2732508 RepID=A0A7Y3RKL1_9PROT|nr:DUF962 domain-containing protein [Parvularcula mediterranea]NNU15766.1 DUF962 domain-containing protein [Parvularcula mediterranea]